METWRTKHSYEVCAFRTRDDFKMTGRNINATGDDFSVPDSLYADDTGLPFCSRADLEQQTPLLMTHFADWGMEIHAGVLDPTHGPLWTTRLHRSAADQEVEI